MAFMSTEDEPRPMVPLTLTSADEWRRLEFTSTSVWSGARPRRVAGRTVSVPSVRPGRGKFSEGSATDSAWVISVVPAFFSDSAEMTSIGAVVSSTVRLATRVPVTTTVAAFSLAAGAAWASAAPLANSDAMETASTCFLGANLFCMWFSPRWW
jgi:hypothetical protein